LGEIELGAVDTSIVTSSKTSESSRAVCGYVVAPNFSSGESVELFTMLHQVTPSVSSFSECLELFLDFCYISVGPSDIIPLAISDLCLSRKFIYLFVLSLRVLPSEFVALYLLEMHDDICKQITICNDDYKFDVYPYSILQEFTFKNVVIVTIHSERFSLGTVSQFYARRTCPIRVMRRITSITNKLISHGTLVSV